VTKFFKGKQKAKQIQTEPRKQEDINKEYSDLIGKLGIEEFKKHVCERNIEQYKYRLLQVNEEANQRTALDQKVKENEVKNEQI